MKTAVFIILFCFSAFADSTWQSRTHECHNEQGFKRRLELKYQSPGEPLPCRVVWFRGDVENYQIEHLLIHAQHEKGKCEAEEKAYLSKMHRWKVSCHLVKEAPEVSEVSKAETAAPTPVPAAQTPQQEPQDDPVEFTARDWEGSYLGVIAGGQTGRSRNKTGSFGYNADDQEWDYSESGLNVGAEFGYNYLSHVFFIGPEIELGYLNLNGTGAQPDSPGEDSVGKTSSDFYMGFRGRIGAGFNRFLLFADGGAVLVNYEKQVVDSCNVAPCGGSTVDARQKKLEFGYTVGGGLEYLLLKKWSLKMEYLFFKLGSDAFNGTTNLDISYDWTGQTSGHIIRAGLNFHF